MIAGKIGTGKTTLLFSIMSETRKMIGEMTVKGKLAYVE
jgi:ABC-type branched-subunit amino acid transport system ATPase component